jgi:hypothetical protein
MNERIRELEKQAIDALRHDPFSMEQFREKFAELIVEECRNVVAEVYRNTPLELCGPLLVADEKIAGHFYGVGK